MAICATKYGLLLALVLAITTVPMTIAGDPDITSDFIVPSNISKIDGNFFTFTGMRSLPGLRNLTDFKAVKTSKAEFPALDGQSVSQSVLLFPPSTANPPHTHPRAAELLVLAEGSLQVGFVDTSNKLYAQTLQAGDLFVFPKGLIHFQYNNDTQKPAIAHSSFGSANAGTVSVPGTVFSTGIDDGILAKSFKTDVATIQSIKTGLKPKA